MGILFGIILVIAVIVLIYFITKMEKTIRLKILVALVLLISLLFFILIPDYNESKKIDKWFSGAFAIVSFYSLIKIEMESWKKK